MNNICLFDYFNVCLTSCQCSFKLLIVILMLNLNFLVVIIIELNYFSFRDFLWLTG
jgi:hypothetical protein